MAEAIIPIVGSILGGILGGGQNSSPTMGYSQPPPAQIHPMFEPGMQDLANIYRNQLFSNPALNSIMTGQGYLGSLFNPGQVPSLFGQPTQAPPNINMGSPPVPPFNPASGVGQVIGRPPLM